MHKIDMIMALSVGVPGKEGGDPRDPVRRFEPFIEGETPFSGVIQFTLMHKDYA
jgi:hypothetical protein